MVTPIHIKGARINTANYHPINFTATICKVLEYVAGDEITSNLKRQQLYSTTLHGLLSDRSCLADLFNVVNMVNKAMNDGSDVDFCFLDFTKSFDLVNHQILSAMLKTLRVTDRLLTCIRNFLTAITFQVRIDNGLFNEAWLPLVSCTGPSLVHSYYQS